MRDRTVDDIVERLREQTLLLEMGPFTFELRSDLPEVGRALHTLYRDFDLFDGADFVDYAVSVTKDSRLFGKWRPGASILFNGYPLHDRFPVRQVLANLEWGMNWCIHRHAFDFLTIHSAALEKDGRALLLLGESGAGKSTLCAALAASGWRLLSDEIALVSLATGQVHGVSRPIILKNDSIDIIRSRWPDSVFGPACPGTVKGTVAHLRPPRASVEGMHEPASPGWICFPEWSPQACNPRAEARDPGESFMQAAELGFNYRILGQEGFRALLALVRQSTCLNLRYHSLDDALGFFDEL